MNNLNISNQQLNNTVSGICRDIANSMWKPDYIVGISRGGIIPAVMISHWFDVPMKPISICLRDNYFVSEEIQIPKDAFGYTEHILKADTAIISDIDRRKKILIVDDINDTGSTFNHILDTWPTCAPSAEFIWEEIWNNTVRFATLVDNESSKFRKNVDYTGLKINKFENDVWIEFPWESWWTQT